jgi:hypothetical protein
VTIDPFIIELQFCMVRVFSCEVSYQDLRLTDYLL